MLESYKNSSKRFKSSLIKTDNKNSYKDLIEKDKKEIKSKRIGKKKNKTMKGLKRLNNKGVKEEKKTKFSLGEIKIAKIHKEANRPLKKVKDLTKEEIKNNSCPCCGLPTKIRGKLEDYNICDSPDEFSDYGDGVILYFSFFKFCIFVTFIASIGIGFFDSYISYNCYDELQKFCDNLYEYYKKNYNYSNIDYNNENSIYRLYSSYEDTCEIYFSNYSADIL